MTTSSSLPHHSGLRRRSSCLDLDAANPDLLAEFQGVAGPIGFFLSETASRVHSEPPRDCQTHGDHGLKVNSPLRASAGLPLKQVELAWADLRDQWRRVAEALNGPISALVAFRCEGARDPEALHAAAETLRAWAATNLEHVKLPDLRAALASFVELVPTGKEAATSLKPFLAEVWAPRIATLRQLGQLTELDLRRLAAVLPAAGVTQQGQRAPTSPRS